MSKKIIVALIAALILIPIMFSVWYLFFRDPAVPASETLKNFLPFGSGDDLPAPTDGAPAPGEVVGGEDDGVVEQPKEVLVNLSETPVAGFVVLNRGTSTTIARYVDRATGHIYEINVETLEKTKLTNQTLPKIYEAYFKEDGLSVLFRSLKDDSDVVENLALTIAPPKSVATSSPDDGLYTVSSTALRGEVGSVAVGSGDSLFYTLDDTRSVVSSTFTGTNLKNLYNSPFTGWVLRPVGKNLLLQTKASAGVPGYAYTLNVSSGALTKVLGPLNGLIANVNRDGTRLLYSYSDSGTTKLYAKNLASGFVSEIFPGTIADKCVWSKKTAPLVFCGIPSNEISASEPDNWYRGITGFSDRIWSFDTDTEVAQVLIEPAATGLSIDVNKPALSANEEYLIFINKLDLSLWALRLSLGEI